MSTEPIPALWPRGAGHQFVVYGDSCSGVPGHIHEATTAAVNRVVARIEPKPEFIVFLGDEVIGLTTDAQALRTQWKHWLEVEMAWLDRDAIPIYHTTANHTTYDAMSERVFQDVLDFLPRNGPLDQLGLSYFVRSGDLLLVFVNTMWTGLGEGRVETDWLESTLSEHADATYKFVLGHHPVFSTNGFSGHYQRDIEPENGRKFWEILVRHGVTAYFCSHMLAFDTRVEQGVLQIMTAGAGTKHRMPEESEYLHAVQVALDAQGLRYQVLDDTGVVRESLEWPPILPPASTWISLEAHQSALPLPDDASPIIAWRLTGKTPERGGSAQTLLSGWNHGSALPPLWIGLFGPENRLGIQLSPVAGRSPHLWYGPALEHGREFDIQVALHRHLGPGGMLWRSGDDAPWSSMRGASAWGIERLPTMTEWSVGVSKDDGDRLFRGEDLRGYTALK
ncbi:hypothetical protein BH09CHL1_BH09CHL1_28010 [soil metagenome]